ncbi:MAG: hypothetical protein QOD77_494 [Thermoplasmata archaeon]|jgi:FlaG/FlaF family flagellin (archaellin)|nr:hypothetical protein [Thermoplasmata archaeon]
MARANRSRRAAPEAGDDEAVSAVIGTVLLLGITAVAISLVAAMGLPALQRLQDRAALQSMAGQLGQAHAALGDLSGVDATRVVPIQLPAGAVAVRDDGRVLVAVDRDAENPACDVHLTGWTDPDTTTIGYVAPGCRNIVAALTPLCNLIPLLGLICTLTDDSVWEAYRVDGASLQAVPLVPTSGAAGTLRRIDGGTFSRDADWLFRLSNGENDPGTAAPLVVYAEAWLSASDRVTWETGGDVGLVLSAGWLWSRDGHAVIEAGAPGLTERALGDGGEDFVLRLPVLRGDPDGGFNDRGEHRLELRQAGAALRTRLDGGNGAEAYRLRLDLDGEHAAAACSALLLRNAQFEAARWQEDSDFSCEDGGAAPDQGVRSVSYHVPVEGAPFDAEPFQLRFLQEVVRVRLAV